MNKSRTLALGAVLVFVVAVAATAVVMPDKGGSDLTGPYDLVAGWPDNPCGDGYTFGSAAGIFAETPNRVLVFQRGCLPVLEDSGSNFGPQSLVPTRNASGFDLSRDDPERHPRWDHNLFIANRAGRIIDSWEQHNALFVRTHKVKISPYDPDAHVWLIDDGANQITKFTNDGSEIVMQLGEFRVRGDDETHFARPTDIAWLPDGTFFISDGYVNTRVVKFDKDGNYLLRWGEKGTPPNDTRPSFMNTVHSVAVDDNRRVYVADRANSRVQIFDENGVFLEAWPGIVRPYYIYMSADQHLWVSDGRTQKFTKFDLGGNLLYSWGTFGSMPGGFWGVHQFDVDSEGALYTADVHIGRPQKFTPKAGANPAHLVGEPKRYVATD